MKRITHFSEEVKIKVLHLLYSDELYNVFMIHFIENQLEDLGEVYIAEEEDEIVAILHLKFDGNSYFTSFYSNSRNHLKTIAKQIKDLDYKRVLLAGKKKDVEEITHILGSDIEVTPNVYYELNKKSYENTNITKQRYNFRRAIDNSKDISKIKEFLIGFFDAQTREEINNITNEEKIHEDLRVGIYLMENEEEVIGMARFSSFTTNYIDITTVYIAPNYRQRGLGKQLMDCMIKTAISNHKVPVTQTSVLNKGANHIYESLGFMRKDDYAFEFVS